MTREEREQLGDMCNDIDCDKVNVHTGADDEKTNAARSRWLKACNGCGAITIGHDIYVSDDGITDAETGAVAMDLLAHEMTHVGQYEDWGALGYFVGAGFTQGFDWLSRRHSEYQVPLPMNKNWTQYGMEQQATIVQLCFEGSKAYCANSPYTFPRKR